MVIGCLSGRVYLLDSPTLSSLGLFDHYKIPLENIKALLKSKPNQVISAVSHPAIAKVMSRILDYPVKTSRQMVTMEHGDLAIVFRPLTSKSLSELTESELQKVPFEITMIRKVCRDCVVFRDTEDSTEKLP